MGIRSDLFASFGPEVKYTVTWFLFDDVLDSLRGPAGASMWKQPGSLISNGLALRMHPWGQPDGAGIGRKVCVDERFNDQGHGFF